MSIINVKDYLCSQRFSNLCMRAHVAKDWAIAFAHQESSLSHQHPPVTNTIDVGLFQLNPEYYPYCNFDRPTYTKKGEKCLYYGTVKSDQQLFDTYVSTALSFINETISAAARSYRKVSLPLTSYVFYHRGINGGTTYIRDNTAEQVRHYYRDALKIFSRYNVGIDW